MSVPTIGASGPAYDAQRRRQSQRRGRQRGCRVDIPAAELTKAGVDLSGPPPYYRVWGAPRGRIVIQLYAKP